MYKRFIRWASDRLDDDGVIAFVTNRAYIDTRQDDGFRQVAANEFSDIYVLDLGSDVRRNRKISGTTHNVFGIQTGVAIGFFVRDKAKTGGCNIHYAKREDAELAVDKLKFMSKMTLHEVEFESITPDKYGNWLNQANPEFEKLMAIADRSTKLAKTVDDERAVFKLYSLGVVTNRDDWVYDFDRNNLVDKIAWFIDKYEEARTEHGGKVVDDGALGTDIKWTRDLKRQLRLDIPNRLRVSDIRRTFYRPFISKSLYYNQNLNEMQYQMPQVFPHELPDDNEVICFLGPSARRPFSVLATNKVPSLAMFIDGTQCLPLYRYTEGGERVSNITDWAIQHINDHYRERWGRDFSTVYPDGISADELFAYTYAVLHDPVYRHDYKTDLLREFPRLPLYADFDAWASMGRRLLDLHINFEEAKPYPLERRNVKPRRGASIRPTLKADKARGTIRLDAETTLIGIPPEAWQYTLGSRSAIEWVLDQYKEKTPRDLTVREHFNTYRFADHKEEMIDLLRRVCSVSVETMKVVDSMAYWDGDHLIVFGDRDQDEWASLGLSTWFEEDEDEEWLASLSKK